MAGNSADSGRSVASKIISILLTFTNGNAYSLTEIARLTGLPISTAHRLATELAAWGMLERTEDGQYRVGQQLRVVGSRAGHPPAMHEKARRVMEDLAAATHATVRLGALDGLDVAYIEKAAGSVPVSMFLDTPPLPSHATAMGKALLAFSSAQTVDAVLNRGLKEYTRFTITTPERLRRALGVTRLTRVAVARRELDLDSCAVATPVFGPGGILVAALELELRDPLADLRTLQPALVVAARSLSRDLTCQVNGGPERGFNTALPSGALPPPGTRAAAGNNGHRG